MTVRLLYYRYNNYEDVYVGILKKHDWLFFISICIFDQSSIVLTFLFILLLLLFLIN